MKRKLSLILALVMMIGVFSPIANAAGKSVEDKLLDVLEEKVDLINFDKIGGLITINKTIKDKSSVISNDLYKNHKSYFMDRKITESEIKVLLENDLYNSMIDIAMDIFKGSDIETGKIKKMMNDFYISLPDTTRKSIDKYAENEDEKIKILSKASLYMLDKQKIGTGKYNSTKEQWTLDLRLNDTQRKGINEAISGNEYEPLKDNEITLVNDLSKKVVASLGVSEINALASLLDDISMIATSTISEDAGGSTGGSGGGGGGDPAPDKEDSKVDLPKDKDEKATVALDKKDVKTTISKTGKTSAKLDENKAINAVKKLRKEAGKTRKANLQINLDGVNNLKFELELSDKLIKELSDSNVSLEIKTKKGNIEIPADTLKNINIPAGAKLEFKMDEVDNSVAQEKMPENKNAKKVLDLSLLVSKDGKSEEVKNFKSPIIITIDVKGLGDTDKLAVYYLNEEGKLEFVAGKIKDDKIALKLNHFSKYVVVESNITFEDTKGHWGQKNIESMAAKEILAGYDDGSFRPDKQVTRAEFAKMIVLAMELEIVDYKGEFSDVNSDAWYAGYIATMLKNKIVQGYDDNTFKAEEEITRAEMGVILGNVLDMKLTKAEETKILNKFNDKAEIKDWAEEGIAKAAEAGIMLGDNGSFNPKNNTTRAEVATAVYRLYNR